MVSNANKVNLKFEEAKPVLEDQLAKSIAIHPGNYPSGPEISAPVIPAPDEYMNRAESRLSQVLFLLGYDSEKYPEHVCRELLK